MVGNRYKWHFSCQLGEYMPPTYHLLREPETAIEIAGELFVFFSFSELPAFMDSYEYFPTQDCAGLSFDDWTESCILPWRYRRYPPNHGETSHVSW